MKLRQGNRFLVWALALSVVVHGTIALVVHHIPTVAAAEEPPTRIRIIKIVPPSPPPPTPKPTPEPPHPAVAQPHAQTNHPHPQAPHVSSNSHANSGPVEPFVAASPGGVQGTGDQGSPAPSPKPVCSQPDSPARTLEAVAPVAPDDAAGVTATADVAVTLDAAGRVIDAKIYQTTNDFRLDRAAVLAARQSTYAPAIVNCLPTGGTYLFRADFTD